MTKDQQKQALDHVNEHWGDKPCPACGDTERWQTDKKLVLHPAIRARKVLPNEGKPHISVTCMNCGYSMFFSAIVAGIYENRGQY